MPNLKQQLAADRAMRDAAKRVVEADVEFIKGDIERQSIGERVKLRAEDGALEAAEFAEANPVQVGTGLFFVIAGIFAWIFRDVIVEAVDGLLGSDEEEEPGEREERFPGEAELDRFVSRMKNEARNIAGELR